MKAIVVDQFGGTEVPDTGAESVVLPDAAALPSGKVVVAPGT